MGEWWEYLARNFIC